VVNNDPNTTCHHCHNLQHYLSNARKYFTSNTQLFFLPGIHHLNTNLTIQNVTNISLISLSAHNIELHCDAVCGITVVYSTNVVMANMSLWWMSFVSILKLINCYHAHLLNVEATKLSLTNAFGYSVASSIRSGTLRIIYSDVTTSKITNHTVAHQNYVPLKLLQDTYIRMLSVSESLILILNIHIYMYNIYQCYYLLKAIIVEIIQV